MDEPPRYAMLAEDAPETYAELLQAVSEVPLCWLCLVELRPAETDDICADCARVLEVRGL